MDNWHTPVPLFFKYWSILIWMKIRTTYRDWEKQGQQDVFHMPTTFEQKQGAQISIWVSNVCGRSWSSWAVLPNAFEGSWIGHLRLRPAFQYWMWESQEATKPAAWECSPITSYFCVLARENIKEKNALNYSGKNSKRGSFTFQE